MGYSMHQRDSSFFIAASDKPAAHAAAVALAQTGERYAWLDTGWEERTPTLEEALTEWGYTPLLDENGNIAGLQFFMEKIGDEAKLFAAIAPFVRSGSFLEMVGEDGDVWRWVWTDGTFATQRGRVVFEGAS
jgi:hypothetical protein